MAQQPRDSAKSLTAQHPPDGSNMRRSETTKQCTPSQNWGYSNENLQLGRQSSLSFNTTRPMSAPTVGDDLHTSQWIPPKRELPFPKKKEPKKAVQTAPIPNNGSENRPLLQSEGPRVSENATKPKTLLDKHGKQQVKRVAVRRTSTPPTSKSSSVVEVPDSHEKTRPTNTRRNSVLWQEEPSPLASKKGAIARPFTSPGLKSKATASRKRPNEEAPKWALAKRVKMVNSGTQTQTLSGREHTAAGSRTSTITAEPVLPAQVIAPAPVPTVPVPVPAPAPSLSEVVSETKRPTEGFMDELGRFVARYGGKCKPVELWEVSGWGRATEEERNSMTESWICEQIEDPSFLELCKHVDAVWKKIGFET